MATATSVVTSGRAQLEKKDSTVMMIGNLTFTNTQSGWVKLCTIPSGYTPGNTQMLINIIDNMASSQSSLVLEGLFRKDENDNIGLYVYCYQVKQHQALFTTTYFVW